MKRIRDAAPHEDALDALSEVDGDAAQLLRATISQIEYEAIEPVISMYEDLMATDKDQEDTPHPSDHECQ